MKTRRWSDIKNKGMSEEKVAELDRAVQEEVGKYRCGVSHHTGCECWEAAHEQRWREAMDLIAELTKERDQLQQFIHDEDRAGPCGDHSCACDQPKGGMRTNGGCQCGAPVLRRELRRVRAERDRLREELERLYAAKKEETR